MHACKHVWAWTAAVLGGPQNELLRTDSRMVAVHTGCIVARHCWLMHCWVCHAAFRGLEYDNPDRPEATNLITIYSLVTGMGTVSHPYREEVLVSAVCLHKNKYVQIFPVIALLVLQEAAANEVCEMSWGVFKPRLADAVRLAPLLLSRSTPAPASLTAEVIASTAHTAYHPFVTYRLLPTWNHCSSATV